MCFYKSFAHFDHIIFLYSFFFIFYQNINRLQVLFSVLSVDVDLIWLTQNNQNFKLKNKNDQGEFKILSEKVYSTFCNWTSWFWKSGSQPSKPLLVWVMWPLARKKFHAFLTFTRGRQSVHTLLRSNIDIFGISS